jgi:UDP-glucose 4-epimerase
MKNKKIIITGGAGFIGSNITRELIKKENNNTVLVFDDLSTGHLKNIQDLIDKNKIEFIEGSITNLDLLNETMRKFDYIFHQAAIPSVPRSIRDPIRSNEINIRGTLNVLIAAKDNNIKKVIYASSSSVYGDAQKLPKSEYMKTSPLSPYAVSKLTGEYYCQVFNSCYKLPTISLRYFNVYGPYQDPEGEYAAVIPKFIILVLNNQNPIIYGDGKQTRDFTFVKDVVQANILAAESKAIGIYNIANGKNLSLNNYIKILMKFFNKKIIPKYDKIRKGDIKHSLADISKAQREIEYSPKFDIEKGLKETIQWFQKQT